MLMFPPAVRLPDQVFGRLPVALPHELEYHVPPVDLFTVNAAHPVLLLQTTPFWSAPPFAVNVTSMSPPPSRPVFTHPFAAVGNSYTLLFALNEAYVAPFRVRLEIELLLM